MTILASVPHYIKPKSTISDWLVIKAGCTFTKLLIKRYQKFQWDIYIYMIKLLICWLYFAWLKLQV